MNKIRTGLAAWLLLFAGLGLTAEVKLDLNTATAGQIASSLDGVGPIMAKAIVSYRQKHGKFKNTDDLLKVPGMEPDVVAHNLTRISLPRGASALP